MEAIGYARTSTEEQSNGLEAQLERLVAEAKTRGWAIEISEEQASGKTLARRPVLREVLGRLDAGEKEALVVTKLDRLARSTLDFARVLDRADKHGWSLVALDLGLDTSTPNGRFAAVVLMAVAELERELIGQRTREGLAVVRRRGVALGHPSTVPKETRRLVVKLRRSGQSWRQITERLNADEIPGPSGEGSKWYPTSVRRVFDREEMGAART